MRAAKLTAIDLLAVDDFALEPMTREESRDVYQLFVERTGRAASVVTSNRDTAEWLTTLDDTLLAQSASAAMSSSTARTCSTRSRCRRLHGRLEPVQLRRLGRGGSRPAARSAHSGAHALPVWDVSYPRGGVSLANEVFWRGTPAAPFRALPGALAHAQPTRR
ncbi:MAG TPA: ATP-binding protein, partial [Anaeromyxobacteraceae bacterium]|nr:ATP-binding protein [Anaeromyxobacteraceae bacterium]